MGTIQFCISHLYNCLVTNKDWKGSHVFNKGFVEKTIRRRRDLILRPTDPVNLCCRRTIITAWPLSGTHGRALSSCRCPGGPCSCCRHAAWMVNKVFPGSVHQERVGVQGFTYNSALPGPPKQSGSLFNRTDSTSSVFSAILYKKL